LNLFRSEPDAALSVNDTASTKTHFYEVTNFINSDLVSQPPAGKLS